MYLLVFISGVVLTILIGFTRSKIKKRNANSTVKYIKRGLLTEEFTRTSKRENTTKDYIVTAEIGVTERTKNKVKVVVIDLKTSIPSDERTNKQVKGIIEGWYDNDSKSIEWFEPHPGDIRTDKIDDLLED